MNLIEYEKRLGSITQGIGGGASRGNTPDESIVLLLKELLLLLFETDKTVQGIDLSLDRILNKLKNHNKQEEVNESKIRT